MGAPDPAGPPVPPDLPARRFRVLGLDGDGPRGLHGDVNLDGVWDVRDCVDPAGPSCPAGPPGY